MAAWFVLVVAVTSSFGDPSAFAAFRNDLHYLPYILTRLPRNAGYVPLVALFLLAGAGPADMMLDLLKLPMRGRLQRVAFAVSLGTVVWTMVLLAVGCAGYLTKPVLYPLLGAGLFITLFRGCQFGRSGSDSVPRASLPWLKALGVFAGLLLAFDLYIALLGALMPEVQFDGRYYHLAEALRYALHGRIFDLLADTRVFPFGLPQYQEILYSGVIVLFGLPAAKVLSWWNLVISVLTIAAFSVEFFKSRVIGLLASAIFVSTPIVSWSASTAGSDLSLVPFTVLSVFAFLRWKADRRTWAWLFLAGVLSGFAFGIKPFAAFNILLLALFITAICLSLGLIGKSAREGFRMAALALLPFALGGLLATLPSLLRTALITGNPVFPAANGIFHSVYVTDALLGRLANEYTIYGAVTSWPAFLMLPWNATVHSDQFRDILGPLLLWAAPFVALAVLFEKRRPLFRQLLAYGFLWLLFWYASKATEIRYAEAIMPFAALGIAYFAIPKDGEATVFASKIIGAVFLSMTVFAMLLNSQFLVPFQRHALLGYVSGLETIRFPYLYEGQPERDIQLKYVPMLEYINRHLDVRQDKVYDAADGIRFNSYSDIDLFNGSDFGGPADMGEWNLSSADAYDRLRRNGITYVMIFEGDESKIRHAPVFAHLQLVHRTAASALYSGKRDHREALYRVL